MKKMAVFGSALADLVLRLPNNTFTFEDSGGVKYMAFPVGEKENLTSTVHCFGGALMNVVTALYHLGFEAVPYCVVGYDAAGNEIVRELQKMSVDVSKIKRTRKGLDGRPIGTGESFLLTLPDGERVALSSRGASACFAKMTGPKFSDDIGMAYVASLGGDLATLTRLCYQASKKSIKVFLNPGKLELDQAEDLKKILPKVSVLALNKEEAQMLVKGDDIETLMMELLQYAPGVIITDGGNGLIASVDGICVRAGLYDPSRKVVARVGAGDACLAGMASVLLEGKDLYDAAIVGLATATEVCSVEGARDTDYSVIYGPFDPSLISFIEKTYI